ncbi:MAG: hypothetical protein WKF77_16420 [Planctomycetaceae bacterium]
MPRVNRQEIFAEDEIQVFHLINRCVRRTFLCGTDGKTGRDFSHRKEWIRDRLEVLAGIFAIDVMGFAVLSNHLHLVARTRPDVVTSWSDDEVALRWWNLFPQRRLKDGSPAEPSVFELNHIRNDASGLKEKRKRLSSVSWFMKCLCEPIAKRGNREENVTGHFWESRFRVQPLLDEMAIAACMAYVDLNPIRAGIATTPETSDFTSVQERIFDRHSAAEVSTSDAQDQRIEHGENAGWLAPVTLDPPRKKVREKQSSRAPATGLSAHDTGSVSEVAGLDRTPAARIKRAESRRSSTLFWNDWTAVQSHGWIWCRISASVSEPKRVVLQHCRV